MNPSFFSVNWSDLLCQGESEELIKKLFESARKNSPSVIFIDQLDFSCDGEESDSFVCDSKSEIFRLAKTALFVQMQGKELNLIVLFTVIL